MTEQDLQTLAVTYSSQPDGPDELVAVPYAQLTRANPAQPDTPTVPYISVQAPVGVLLEEILGDALVQTQALLDASVPERKDPTSGNYPIAQVRRKLVEQLSGNTQITVGSYHGVPRAAEDHADIIWPEDTFPFDKEDFAL